MLKPRFPAMLLLSALALAAAPLAARAADGLKPALRLYVLECGHNEVKDQSVFSPGVNEGVGREMAVNCYVVRHPKGILVWNTGLSDALADKPDGVTVMNGNFHLTVRKTFASQLAEIGVKPEEVTYLALSHLHSDHAGNANLFLHSTLILQEEEWAAGFGDDPGRYGFNPALYGMLKDRPAIKLKGDYDLFGDGSVVILRSIGHTPGHQSLFVDLPQSGPLVLSGDLWHFAAQREHRRVPKFNFDKEQTLKSMDVIERFVAQHHATVWIEHDFEQSAAIAHAPQYHE